MRRSHISKRPWLSLSLVGALGLAACGGGGGDDANEGEADGAQSLTIESTAEFDGGTRRDNSTDTASAAEVPVVGDGTGIGAAATVYNGLWSFDLASVPPGAQVTTATLFLVQVGWVGDPQGSFALARVDHVNIGNTFPATASGVAALTLDFAQIADIATNGVKQVDVTAQVIADLDAGRTRSSYRMRMPFSTDNDGSNDWCIMSDAERATDASQLPRIVIEYTIP